VINNKETPETGADLVAEFIAKFCFPEVFVVTGGACAFIMDAIYRNPNSHFRVFQHEQAAAMAADAIWRVNRKLGVTVATSGPGATNLITGIACSWFDSIPTLHITGQVNQSESSENLNVKVRQAGFQETDIVKMVEPITKLALKVKNIQELSDSLVNAYFISQSGRPGPCLIDIPMDVQKAKVDAQIWQNLLSNMETNSQQNKVKEKLVGIENKISDFINSKENPLILLGAGLGLSGNFDKALEVIKKSNTPFVTSWNALSYFKNYTQDNYLGSIGVYGSRVANAILDKCDGLLILGSRLDNRQRSGNPKIFAPNAKKLVFDIDKEELNKYVSDESYEAIELDLGNLDFAEVNFNELSDNWKSNILSTTENVTDGRSASVDKGELSPYEVTEHILKNSDKESIIVSDCGANLCWVYQSFVPFGGILFTAGGNSPMGYSLPAAIGAHFADPTKKIICFIGDGGLQMNIQELQTISHYQIPMKIIILNNFGFGIIKQFQDAYFESRYVASGEGYSVPDFEKISKAYNIIYSKIRNTKELLQFSNKKLSAPEIIDVHLPENALITPKLEMGKSFSNQFPYSN
jgi:acetolactate synthase-1/2/3 large subunit